MRGSWLASLVAGCAAARCPRVFVYDLPRGVLQDVYGAGVPVAGAVAGDSDEAVVQLLESDVFGHAGDASKPFLRDTQQWVLAALVLYRLKASVKCRTLDPSKADLFYVPLLAGPKHIDDFQRACGNVTEAALLSALPHLTRATACKHFLVVSKTFYACETAPWYARPARSSLLASVARLAYDAPVETDDSAAEAASEDELFAEYASRFSKRPRGGGDGGDDARTSAASTVSFPNTFSVPYPSSVHWLADQPDPLPTVVSPNATHQREVLALFMGSLGHGDLAVRAKIEQACHARPTSVCSVVHLKTSASRKITRKSNATFCLEPGGDTPTRKSISDSIAFGCIPVFFDELAAKQFPWHWGDRPDDARVVIDRRDFINGSLDLLQHLADIPRTRVTRMQAALAKLKRGFQYSLDDDDHDALGKTLRGLQNFSHTCDQRPQL